MPKLIIKNTAYIWARMLSCNLLILETHWKNLSFLDFKDLGFIYCDMCGKEWLEYYELFHILCFKVKKKAWLYFKNHLKLLRICCQGSQDTLCQFLANKTNIWIIKCTDVFATLDRKLYDYKRCFLLACQAMQPWWMSVIYSASRVDTCINGSQ